MPQNNAAAITTNGATYKTCVKLTDTAGNTPAYGATSNFTALISAPTCTGANLAGDAADAYINGVEHLNTTAVISGVTGSSSTVSSTNYSVIASSATCDGSQTFASSVPGSNHSAFDNSGTYKVCARVSDAVSQYGYCASSTITSVNVTITFTSIDRTSVVSDGYLNPVEHATSTALVTNLVGTNYDTAKYAVDR